MRNRSFEKALACTGAVVGAGFSSGREVATFFSRYGLLGWWLMALAVLVMTTLCWMLLDQCQQIGASGWCDLFKEEKGWIRFGAKGCVVLLLIITTGAMMAASGQMVALVWNIKHAYWIGVILTVTAAWAVGWGSMRLLGMVSGILVAMLALAAVAGLAATSEQAVRLTAEIDFREGLAAALRATAYAAMNLTLAIGVVCCSNGEAKQNRATALCFGTIMLLLLGISHLLCSRYPQWLADGFPIVRILAQFGRAGFWLSVTLVYLSVFTSLTAALYALRSAAQTSVHTQFGRFAIVLVLPLGVSMCGFAQIVDRFYAPAGLVCLLMVFYPLIRRGNA